MEKVDLSTTKFKGRVILGIGERRISRATSESESSSDTNTVNPYIEYRQSMKVISKSPNSGPIAKENSEKQVDSD